MMKVVIAPDSFKGSLMASEVAEAVARGLRTVISPIETVKIPLGDGGEGTADALVRATGGTFLEEKVTGPLGQPVKARFGILGDGRTAVIEMAAASGLPMVPEGMRNPLLTTTYGTGELIAHALKRGCRRMVIGAGGSATVDAGTGALAALGVRFLDSNGRRISGGGGALRKLDRIDPGGLPEAIKAGEVEILVAADVDNPLVGPAGAAAVYGPQKGATPEMVKMLEGCLRRFVEVVRAELGVDVSTLPGGGAAGGLAAGLAAVLGAQVKPGVELVLEAVKFDKAIEEADLVVTGEGRIDGQTLRGKVVLGVARAVRAMLERKCPDWIKEGEPIGAGRLPVVVLAGSVGDGVEKLYAEGIDAVMSILPGPIGLAEAMDNAPRLVEAAAARLGRLLMAGARLPWGQRKA